MIRLFTKACRLRHAVSKPTEGRNCRLKRGYRQLLYAWSSELVKIIKFIVRWIFHVVLHAANANNRSLSRHRLKIQVCLASYCRTEMYAGRVECCPLVSHGQYADDTDGQTPDRYIMLSARGGQLNNNENEKYNFLTWQSNQNKVSLFIPCLSWFFLFQTV